MSLNSLMDSELSQLNHHHHTNQHHCCSVGWSVHRWFISNNCSDILLRHSGSPEDGSYWLWWSPDLLCSTTSRLTFKCLSEISQLLDGLAGNLWQTDVHAALRGFVINTNDQPISHFHPQNSHSILKPWAWIKFPSAPAIQMVTCWPCVIHKTKLSPGFCAPLTSVCRLNC